MFTTRIGTSVDPANLLDDFKLILKKAELPNIRSTTYGAALPVCFWRLTFIRALSWSFSGHAQISLTMEIYSHVVPGLLRDGVDKLG